MHVVLRFLLKPSNHILLLVLLSIAFSLHSCDNGESSQKTSKENLTSHEKMLALLAKIREEVNSPNNIYASEARLAYYDDAKQSALNFETQMQLAMKKAMTLLEFGDEEKAVAFM